MSTVSTVILLLFFFFFFNDTATTEIYTLSLHDALPISRPCKKSRHRGRWRRAARREHQRILRAWPSSDPATIRHQSFDENWRRDRKSTRLNSSHSQISYAVFCLKKKKK